MKRKNFIEISTIEEVAQTFKLLPYTIRRLCREDKIPAFLPVKGGFASCEKIWRTVEV